MMPILDSGPAVFGAFAAFELTLGYAATNSCATEEVSVEYGVIETQVHIDATLDIVYAIVSTPEHISQWWADSADFDSKPGGSGEIVFRDSIVQLTVLETVPGRLFRFAWNFPKGETPTPSNSMIVTFELSPEGSGTLLRVVEEGMRDQGWEAATLEEYYRSHTRGWTRCLDELIPAYAAKLKLRWRLSRTSLAAPWRSDRPRFFGPPRPCS